jgi:hypothetical protein
MFFEAGQVIVRRTVHRDGRIAAVETARVVSDDARGLLTWTAAGSHVMHRTTITGESIRKMRLRQRDSIPTMLSPTTWHGGSVLILTPPDGTHSVYWFFDLAGGFTGWYVNLESPARRWFGGIDTADHALDIWVEPDRSWSWKDEDELAERVGHPSYWTAQEADAIRAAGERLIPIIEAGTHPFDGTLIDFRPDPLWDPTTLTAHWDYAGHPQMAGQGAHHGPRDGSTGLT